MMSAPNATSGRSLRTWLQNAIASARVVAPLHALEDEIVAGLQRQMQVRHQPRLVAQCVEQIVVGLHRVDRRQPQPRQLGNLPQNALDQRAQPRRAGKIRAVVGDIDAGEHQLTMAVRDQAARLRHAVVDRQRARIAAPERNDAERAAMVAAVLHLQEGARMALDNVHRVPCVPFHRHDVADGDTRAVVGPRICPCSRVELFLVADDAVDLRHGRERAWLGLRRAAGDHDARIGPLALDAPDGLARLPHRFGGNSAGIYHHRVVETGRRAPDHFRLGDVEPAAEGDDVEAHATPALPNNAGSKLPANSNSTGPVIST